VFQTAGLTAQQFEVVIELRAGGELAVQAFVARDLAAVVTDRDFARADVRAPFQLVGTSSATFRP
jgi:hypothetical protein